MAAAKAGIPFDLVGYDYDSDAERFGLAAAEALGEPPSRVFKTLLIEADGKPVCAVLTSDREVSMERITAAGTKLIKLPNELLLAISVLTKPPKP